MDSLRTKTPLDRRFLEYLLGLADLSAPRGQDSQGMSHQVFVLLERPCHKWPSFTKPDSFWRKVRLRGKANAAEQILESGIGAQVRESGVDFRPD
jgi:hypothetical protein